MSFSGSHDAQPKPSDRDVHTPVADEKHDIKPGDKAPQHRGKEASPLDVRAGSSASDREQPPPAPKTGGDIVGDDEVGNKDVEVEMTASSGEPLAQAILDAINTGVPAAVNAVLAKAEGGPIFGALVGMTSRGMPLIAHAARAGNVEIFAAVNRSMAKHLSLEQARRTLTSTAENGHGSLLVAAADGGSAVVFSKVVRLLDGEVLRTISESWPYGSSTVVSAAQDGGMETFKAVTKILDRNLTRGQAVEVITPNAAGDPTAFTAAVLRGNRHVVWAWAAVLLAKLPHNMVIDAATTTFAANLHDLRRCLETMPVLVALGANVTAAHLIGIKPDITLDELKTCFLGGVSSAENPFVAGMALSVAIETAVRMLPERERRTLSDLQDTLDELLLEVLERLPQSIQRLPGGIDGCVALFEPETVRDRGVGGRVGRFEPERVGVGVREPEAVEERAAEYRGPLKLALQERQFTETICVSPLVFEYLSHKFVSDLPMPWDSEDHISATYDTCQRDAFCNEEADMVAGSAIGRLMQGLRLTPGGSLDRPRDWEKLLSSTIYPGAQFVVAGVITKPMAFYKVPAIRMALDLIVHLSMLAVYTAVVLEDDKGALSKTEIALTFHVVAEIVSELGQMHASFHEYFQDEWNWLESASLLLLAGGLFYRIGNSGGFTGRALFALSAPLVFSRVLFFGQVLRRQGLVVQAIMIMIGELLQFALVLGVIMMGFTVAFFALFGEERSYGNVWLDVFKAMLGEVGVFDDFFDDAYGGVARFLLVVYLLVMAVMLLNLLIAILSTEHAKIEQGQDRAFRVSKVRIIKLYSRIVDHDLQPPPFNLVQLALTLPFLAIDRVCHTSTHGRVKRMVGGLVFWLIMGPLSILVAWGLSLASAPSVVLALWRGTIKNRFRGSSSVYFVLSSATAVLFRFYCVPTILSALWIKAGFVEYFHSTKDVLLSLTSGMPDEGVGAGVEIYPGNSDDTYRGGGGGGAQVSPGNHSDKQQPRRSNAVSVAEMLKRTPGGKKSVREILAYLGDLASTGGLHQKRRDKDSPATAEQLNRARSQLQSSSEKRGDVLLEHLQSIDAAIITGVQEVGNKVNHRVDALDRRVDERLDRFEEKMAAIVAEYLAKSVDDR